MLDGSPIAGAAVRPLEPRQRVRAGTVSRPIVVATGMQRLAAAHPEQRRVRRTRARHRDGQ